MGSNLLSLKPTDGKYYSHPRLPSQKHLGQCLTKYLGAITEPCCPEVDNLLSITYALVSMGCHNKIPQPGCLNSRNLFFTVLEHGIQDQGVSRVRCLVISLCWSQRQLPSLYVLTWPLLGACVCVCEVGEGGKALWYPRGPTFISTYYLPKALSPDTIPLGVRASTQEFGGGDTVQFAANNVSQFSCPGNRRRNFTVNLLHKCALLFQCLLQLQFC